MAEMDAGLIIQQLKIMKDALIRRHRVEEAELIRSALLLIQRQKTRIDELEDEIALMKREVI